MHTTNFPFIVTNTNYLPEVILNQPLRSLVLASSGSAEYESLALHITSVFQKSYGARIEVNYPLLMGFVDAEENPLVALGIRRTMNDSKLFVEHYLDQPAESCLQAITQQPVMRHTIAEVGNLASSGKGNIFHLLYSLSCYLEQEGISHLLFTGTSLLKRYINSLGLYPHILAEADPVRLGQDATVWGSYYDTRPKVMAGSVSAFRAGLEVHCRNSKRGCE